MASVDTLTLEYLKRIAVALEKLADLKEKELLRG